MVKFISVLPKIVLREIITSWLSLPQIGKLDSALCVTLCRQIFEETLQYGHFCCEVWNLCCVESFVAWVVRRKVRLQEAVLSSALLLKSDLRCSFLTATGNELRSIEITSKDLVEKVVEAALLDASVHCCQLRECTLSTANDFAITTLLARNPFLERVTLQGSPELIGAVFHLLPNTTVVKILSPVRATAVEKFAKGGPSKLTHLSLVGYECYNVDPLKPFRTFQSLIELRIGCIDATNFCYVTLAMPNLVIFQCSSSYMSESCVKSLCMQMPYLQTLIFLRPTAQNRNGTFDVTPSLIGIILDRLVHLRQLVMTETGCEKLLRPHPLPAIPTSVLGAGMYTLEEMYIYTPPYDCYHPQWYSLDGVMARCPALRRVGVSFLPVASTEDMESEAFFRACAQARVERLVVTHHSLIDSHIVFMSNYSELLLYNCAQLGDHSFTALARNNPFLRVLHVHKAGPACVHGNPLTITHRSLMVMLEQCPLLHTVEFVFYAGDAKPAHVHAQSMFMNMLRKLYPRVTNFVCNVV